MLTVSVTGQWLQILHLLQPYIRTAVVNLQPDGSLELHQFATMLVTHTPYATS